MGAAVLPHLRRKLVSVRVVMAIGAALRLELEVVVRAFSLVAATARDRLMFAVERKLGAAMLLDGEQSGPESLLVMTGLAVGVAETPAMHVFVTVTALVELETAIALLHRKLG